jgi:hypothetical protein
MALCLAAGALTASLAAQAFTLSWMHTVEKIEWQESWRVEAEGLVLIASRVKGSGAGMEVPAGAVAAGGWFHFWPERPPLRQFVLARAAAAGDYALCWDGGCLPLARLVPRDPDQTPVVLFPCFSPP